MFKALREFRKRLYQYRTRESVHRELDSILEAAKFQQSLEDKLSWLVQLLQWIRFEGHVDVAIEKEVGRLQVARLRFLMVVLDRNPQWKVEVARILRAIVGKVSGLELYTETGLPREVGMWSEFSDRIMYKILPTPPLEEDLTNLFWALFPNPEDSAWVSAIDAKTFDAVVALFNYEVMPSEHNWNRLRFDLLDSLDYLIIQLRATGLSPAIRSRLDKQDYRESAFFHLDESIIGFQNNFRSGSKEEALACASKLRMTVWECKRELAQVREHLNEHGVSVAIVFQMARLRTYLARVESLLEILVNDKIDSKKVSKFLATLIEDTQELRSISTLFSQNIAMLARKVVERAAETGEHYITRTKEEYNYMLRAACGGGAVTALTVYMKIFILSWGWSNFGEGFAAGINYSISFVFIHMLGYTLGTKQPAMTAPALASRLKEMDSEKGLRVLVDDIVHIIRSQVAAVGGNVLLVFPCAVLIDACYFFVSGTHIISTEKAKYALSSIDIFGPAMLYAAFTGVILWSSSLIAGWADNWFALNKLSKTLGRAPALVAVFGQNGAKRIAYYLDNNISALAGNISLGMMLGMFPEIMKFFGIPLDIRHVTLSAGTMGAAMPVLGIEGFKSAEFWRAVVGLFAIGASNVLVSFAMALWIAVKARGVKNSAQVALRGAIFARLRSQPLSFFVPVGTTVNQPAEQKAADSDGK